MSDEIRQTIRVSDREHAELYWWLLEFKTADERWSDALRRALTLAMECAVEGSQLTRIEQAVSRVEQRLAQLEAAPVHKQVEVPTHAQDQSVVLVDDPFGGGFDGFN